VAAIVKTEAGAICFVPSKLLRPLFTERRDTLGGGMRTGCGSD
jgi:hypothetical protein